MVNHCFVTRTSLRWGIVSDAGGFSWAALIGYASGVWIFAPSLRQEHLLPTILVIHSLDAILCRVFARNNGDRPNLWTAIGFLTGIWAVLYLLIHTRRRERSGISHLRS